MRIKQAANGSGNQDARGAAVRKSDGDAGCCCNQIVCCFLHGCCFSDGATLDLSWTATSQQAGGYGTISLADASGSITAIPLPCGSAAFEYPAGIPFLAQINGQAGAAQLWFAETTLSHQLTTPWPAHFDYQFFDPNTGQLTFSGNCCGATGDATISVRQFVEHAAGDTATDDPVAERSFNGTITFTVNGNLCCFDGVTGCVEQVAADCSGGCPEALP